LKHNPGFLSLVVEAQSRISEITAAEYKSLVASQMPHDLVDVREESEWAAGHAAGAIHIGKGIIERDIESIQPDSDRLLILYCGGGYRSALAADALQRMGYTNVRSFAGGWRAWNEAALPREPGEAS
jgi:rhodanese-related sulfurtransferase